MGWLNQGRCCVENKAHTRALSPLLLSVVNQQTGPESAGASVGSQPEVQVAVHTRSGSAVDQTGYSDLRPKDGK